MRYGTPDGSPNATYFGVALAVAGVALIAVVGLSSPVVRRAAATDPIQLGKHPDPDRMWFAGAARLMLVTRETSGLRLESCDANSGSCVTTRVAMTGASPAAPYAVHAGPDVTTIIWAVESTICLVDLAATRPQPDAPRCTASSGAAILSLALLDARRAVIARTGGEIEFRDVRVTDAGQPTGTRLRGDWPLHGDGEFVVAIDHASGNFAVLDAREGTRRRVAFYVCPEGSEPTGIGVLPSGEPVVGTADGSVLFPRGEAWAPLGPLPGAVRTMDVRRDSRVVVAGEFDGVRLVGVNEPEPRVVVGGLSDIVSLVVGDGHLALSRGGPVTVYRLSQRLVPRRLLAHPLVWTGLAMIAVAGAVVGPRRAVVEPGRSHAGGGRRATDLRPITPLAAPGIDDEFRSVDAPSWRPDSGGGVGATDAPASRRASDGGSAADLEPGEMAIGSRLGHYEIRALLGSGAMGRVYEAYDLGIRRSVAIKVLSPKISRDPQALARFRKEAVALGAVSHPNVLGIHQIGEHEGTTYVVMERLHGESLRARLDRGALEPNEVRRIGISVAQGLAAAHQRGMVHRDIKPDNIFLADNGVKILDFGLARAFVDETHPDREGHPTLTRMTSPGAMVGTFGYMSPEQAVGDTIDGRSDLFALGCVMYEMLTGEGPFDRKRRHESITALLGDVAPSIDHDGDPSVIGLSDVITRCLARRADDRFGSAEQVIDALRGGAA